MKQRFVTDTGGSFKTGKFFVPQLDDVGAAHPEELGAQSSRTTFREVNDKEGGWLLRFTRVR